MKRLAIFLILSSGLAFGSAADIYMTPLFGSTCLGQPAFQATFFNTAGNWGSGATQIGPGTTVHLCGVFSSTLTFQGSGTSGSPITLHFETGAKFSTAHWGAGANVIFASGKSNLVVDGGTNGTIEATNNGSSPTYGFQDDETGVDLGTCANCVIKNLTISNMFVKNTSDNQGVGECVHLLGSGSSITGITCHDANIGIGYNYPAGGTNTVGEIAHNTIYHTNIAISVGDTGAGASFTGLSIHDNEIYDASNWDDLATNAFHHNGVMIFVTNDNSSVPSPTIYNNYIHGDFGARETGHIFLDGEGNGSAGSYAGAQIFNNVLADDSAVNTPSNGLIITKANGGSPAVAITNNTEKFLAGNQGRCNMNQGAVYTLKNNIGIQCSLFVYLSSGTAPSSDYNDKYLNSGSDATEGSHSVTTDPKLGANFVPTVGSGAIGAGLNFFATCNGRPNPGLGALCFDKNGVARASVGVWNIGAFESNVSPVMVLAPPTLAFGSQTLLTTSAPQVVTVTNTGTNTLHVAAWGLASGVNFAVSASTCTTSSFNLAASASCTASITFTPTAGGTLSDTLSFTDDAVGTPHTVTMSGGSVAPPTNLSVAVE